MSDKRKISISKNNVNEMPDSLFTNEIAYLVKKIKKLTYDELLSLSYICQSIECIRYIDVNKYPKSVRELFSPIQQMYEQNEYDFEMVYDYINSLILSIRTQEDSIDKTAISSFFQNF